jgi:hypothetical protein
LNDLYSTRCDCCGGELHDLADDTEDWDKIYTDIAKQLLEGKDLDTDAIYNKTAAKLIAAMNNGLGGTAFDDNDSRIALQKAFIQNLEAFSYAKTLTQFNLFKDYVFNNKGQIQSFATVKKAVADTGEVFNRNYLAAEHQFVTQSAIMAHKWETLDAEYLEFTTVGDSLVRPEHKLFDKFTALKSDPIWRRLYTPLDWGCRCTVIPGISKNLSKEYNSEWANKVVDPLVKGTIFDNNVALTKVIFNDKHPYFKAKEVKEKNPLVKELKPENSLNMNDHIKGEFPTNKEIKNILLKYAELSPGDFRNGLDDVKFLKSKTYMMQHSMSYSPMTGNWVGGSKITLSSHEFSSIKFNPLEEFRTGLSAIKKGEKMTFNQEYSFESLWHEILHAKTNTKPYRLSQLGTKNMEIVNQFCARHTYPDFIKKFGGEAIHQSEVLDNGYGYKGWITEFRGKLKANNIDEKQAAKDLMPSLMKDYSSLGKVTSDYILANAK